MVGRSIRIIYLAIVLQAGGGVSFCSAQETVAQIPGSSPSPSSSPFLKTAPRTSGQVSQGKLVGERPFLRRANDLGEVRKFLERLNPDQQEKFLTNFQRWQEMTPEERRALRELEEFRRQKILEEIERSIKQSGLQFDHDAREVYVLRYTQERRKIEQKLQKEMEDKRRPLLDDMDIRLREEFKTMTAKMQAASTPSPTLSPANSPPPAAK